MMCLACMQEAAKEHDSCINNLHTSLNAIGHPLTDDPDHYLPPSPFNLWMAVSLKNEGSQLSWDPPAKVTLWARLSGLHMRLSLTQHPKEYLYESIAQMYKHIELQRYINEG